MKLPLRKTLSLTTKNKEPKQVEWALEKVIDYMNGRLNQPLSLEALCQISGLSYRDLLFQFVKRFDMSPTQWFRQRQAELANAQLKEQQAAEIEEISKRWEQKSKTFQP